MQAMPQSDALGYRTASGDRTTAGSQRDPAEWAHRLDGLIAMLSHDLRTPLAAISGWLFLLESGKLDPVAQKRALAKIKNAVDDQVQMIDETLLISRSETGRIELEPEPVDIGDVLAASVERARADASAKGLVLNAEFHSSPAFVDGEADRLRRAFDLLFAHALRVTPAGGRITVTTALRPAHLEISISDTGNGHSGADLPYVLDPFRPNPDGSPRSVRGVERGLLLAKAVIAAHGGTLRLSSAGSGTGETFAIEFPVLPSRGATTPTQAAE